MLFQETFSSFLLRPRMCVPVALFRGFSYMCILVESNYSEKNTEGREKNPIDHLLFAPLVRDPFFNFFFFFGKTRTT